MRCAPAINTTSAVKPPASASHVRRSPTAASVSLLAGRVTVPRHAAHAVELGQKRIFLEASLRERKALHLPEFGDNALVVTMPAGAGERAGLIEQQAALFVDLACERHGALSYIEERYGKLGSIAATCAARNSDVRNGDTQR